VLVDFASAMPSSLIRHTHLCGDRIFLVVITDKNVGGDRNREHYVFADVDRSSTVTPGQA